MVTSSSRRPMMSMLAFRAFVGRSVDYASCPVKSSVCALRQAKITTLAQWEASPPSMVSLPGHTSTGGGLMSYGADHIAAVRLSLPPMSR